MSRVINNERRPRLVRHPRIKLRNRAAPNLADEWNAAPKRGVPIRITTGSNFVLFSYSERSGQKMIYKQEIFIDDAGVIIHRDTPHNDGITITNGPPIARFHAVGIIRFVLPNGQPAQVQFKADIPGDTVEEAYANFPEAFKAAEEKCKEETRSQLAQQAIGSIIVPGQPGGRGLVH